MRGWLIRMPSDPTGLPIKVNIEVNAETVKEMDQLLERSGLAHLSATMAGVLASWIELFHRENIIRYSAKVGALLPTLPFSNERPIPPTLAIPAIRAAAEEGDEVMLDLHARLLAGFRNADRAGAPNKSFISILSGMQPLDFAVLRYLLSADAVLAVRERVRRMGQDLAGLDPRRVLLDPGEVAAALDVPESGVILAAQNLHRLGCMRLTSMPGQHVGPSWVPLSPAGCQISFEQTIYTPLELATALLDALGEPWADAGDVLQEPGGQA